jgi:hypothetical protein
MDRRRRLTVKSIESVGVVDAPDNPPAAITFWKRKRTFTQEERDAAAASGAAMPDGGYPILNAQHLRDAIQSFGRAKNPQAVKQHIIRRARKLGLEDLLPEDWATKDAPSGAGQEGEPMADEPEEQEPIEVEKVEEAVAAETAEPAEPVEDGLEKRLQDFEKQLETVRLEKEAAEAALAEEVNKRRDLEWVEKAKPLEPLLGPDMAPVLRKLSDAAPEEYTKLEGALTAALGKFDLAKVLTEVGTDGSAPEPIQDRDRWVREFRKLHPDVSVKEARGRFWAEHPEAKQKSREA